MSTFSHADTKPIRTRILTAKDVRKAEMQQRASSRPDPLRYGFLRANIETDERLDAPYRPAPLPMSMRKGRRYMPLRHKLLAK